VTTINTSGPDGASASEKTGNRSVAEKAEIQGYTWDCNRHTFAGKLVMARVDLRMMAELLGHGTLQIAMRYSHLAPEHQASVVDRLANSGK
jgi:site-specific recombinase XerD